MFSEQCSSNPFKVFLWIAKGHKTLFKETYGVHRSVDTFLEALEAHGGGEHQLRINNTTPVRGIFVNVDILPFPLMGEVFHLVSSLKLLAYLLMHITAVEAEAD